MVNGPELDLAFQALGHETRRLILNRLVHGPLTVGDIAKPLAISVAMVSKHLRILEAAGLIRRTDVGRTNQCALEPSGLESADRWLGAAIGRPGATASPGRRRRPVSWTVPHVDRREGGRSTIGDLVIRSANPEDWPQLWPLIKGMGVADESDDNGRHRFDAVIADPAWTILVAEFADRLLGYAAMQDRGLHLRGDEHRSWRLHDMFVRPESRRQGVGRALMWAVPKAASEGGAAHLEWQAHEARSAPFYERLGYKGEPCPQPEYPAFEVTFSSDVVTPRTGHSG